MNHLAKQSFLHALGVFAYIVIVAGIMTNGERLFPDDRSFFGPIAFLTLFVISAAITGSLVVGKPIMMYLAGQKHESATMFMYTVGWLALGLVVILGLHALLI